MPIPPLDYIESQGTRWAASALRYLLDLKGPALQSELKRLIGEPEAASTTTEKEG